MEKHYYVYIITNRENKVLYIGVTNDLMRRIYEHKNKTIKGFSAKYNLGNLVYFEETPNIEVAILREKQLKGWTRAKKIDLINSSNNQWKDLSLEFTL